MVRVRAVGAEGGAHTVHAYPFPLCWAALGCSTAASPEQLQLPLEVPLLALQRLQLVLALPICLFKFLLIRRRMGRQRKGSLCTLVVYQRRQEEVALHRKHFVAPVGAPSNLWCPLDVSLEPLGDFLHLLPTVLFATILRDISEGQWQRLIGPCCALTLRPRVTVANSDERDRPKQWVINTAMERLKLTAAEEPCGGGGGGGGGREEGAQLQYQLYASLLCYVNACHARLSLRQSHV